MHGLVLETSICYWQDQPGSLFSSSFLFLFLPRRGWLPPAWRRHPSSVGRSQTDKRTHTQRKRGFRARQNQIRQPVLFFIAERNFSVLHLGLSLRMLFFRRCEHRSRSHSDEPIHTHTREAGRLSVRHASTHFYAANQINQRPVIKKNVHLRSCARPFCIGFIKHTKLSLAVKRETSKSTSINTETDELHTLQQGREISRLALFTYVKVTREFDTHRPVNGLLTLKKYQDRSVARG